MSRKYLGDLCLMLVLLALLALPFSSLGLSRIQSQNSNVEVLSITDTKETTESTDSLDLIRHTSDF